VNVGVHAVYSTCDLAIRYVTVRSPVVALAELQALDGGSVNRALSGTASLTPDGALAISGSASYNTQYVNDGSSGTMAVVRNGITVDLGAAYAIQTLRMLVSSATFNAITADPMPQGNIMYNYQVRQLMSGGQGYRYSWNNFAYSSGSPYFYSSGGPSGDGYMQFGGNYLYTSGYYPPMRASTNNGMTMVFYMYMGGGADYMEAPISFYSNSGWGKFSRYSYNDQLVIYFPWWSGMMYYNVPTLTSGWTLFVLRLDQSGSSPVMTAWVNGVQTAPTSSWPTSRMPDTAMGSTQYMGYNAYDGGYYYYGALHTMMWYERGLSDDEVAYTNAYLLRSGCCTASTGLTAGTVTVGMTATSGVTLSLVGKYDSPSGSYQVSPAPTCGCGRQLAACAAARRQHLRGRVRVGTRRHHHHVHQRHGRG
jgi:hypothetical protein